MDYVIVGIAGFGLGLGVWFPFRAVMGPILQKKREAAQMILELRQSEEETIYQESRKKYTGTAATTNVIPNTTWPYTGGTYVGAGTTFTPTGTGSGYYNAV